MSARPNLLARHGGWAIALTLLASAAAQAATLQVTVLAKDGQPLPDAVVIIEPTNLGARPPVPAAQTTEILQQKQQFVPRVSVIPLGSQVVFSNLDSYDHHVRGLPAGMASLNDAPASGFTLRLAGKVQGQAAAAATETLNQVGPMQLGCHLHASMRGSIYVSDSPWVVKTDANGMAEILNLPLGNAQVRLWFAEQLVEAPATTVTITPNARVTVPTHMSGRRPRR
jgi:plastocyanin